MKAIKRGSYLYPVVEVLHKLIHERRYRSAANIVLVKEFINLFLLSGWFLADCTPLTLFFNLVCLAVSYCCKPGTKTHGNGTSEELRKTSNNDKAGRSNAVNGVNSLEFPKDDNMLKAGVKLTMTGRLSKRMAP